MNKYSKSWKQAKLMKTYKPSKDDLIVLMDSLIESSRNFINKLK